MGEIAHKIVESPEERCYGQCTFLFKERIRIQDHKYISLCSLLFITSNPLGIGPVGIDEERSLDTASRSINLG